MLEVCDRLFDFFFFYFAGVTLKRLPWVSEETLNFGLLDSVETVLDYRNF